MPHPLHFRPISVVARRQLGSFLGNPIGYVYLFSFVLISGALLFIPDGFYLRNVADLEPLHAWMPVLLAVLLPAIGMGAWAAEREGGTEELLLTMPLTIADAVLGKYLAILVYFAIALISSGANVVALFWLGSPDTGLVAANYLGWMAMGAMFGAVSLVASVLVAWPVAAFILGLVFCSALLGILQWCGFSVPFDQGRMPLPNLLVAGCVIAALAAVAIFLLASRRWRSGSGRTVALQVITVVAGLILCLNFARLGSRLGADLDLTSSGLTSLHPDSRKVVGSITSQVVCTAVISAELPVSQQPRAREILAKLDALRRANPDHIQLDILRPESTADPLAVEALQEFAIEPIQIASDEVTGREMVQLLMGMHVACGDRAQAIPNIPPGESVEYHLVRAIRNVTRPSRILGIADDDVLLTAGGQPTTGKKVGDSELVMEWRKSWDVRRVDLSRGVPSGLAALVVPQVSSLPEPAIRNLGTYLGQGGPALLFQDPVPYYFIRDERRDVLADLPRRHENGYENTSAPKAADISSIWNLLGIQVDLRLVFWSDYSPSHQFREIAPKPFVWTSADQLGINPHPINRGIQQMILPYPGVIRPASLTTAGTTQALTIEPLLRVVPTTSWGLTHTYAVTDKTPLGGSVTMLPPDQVELKAAPPESAPGWIAAAITAPGSATVAPRKAVVVADLDLYNIQFFHFHRGDDGGDAPTMNQYVQGLGNVSWLENAVDWLAGDLELAGLRTARPTPRPLDLIQELIARTRDQQRREEDAARSVFKATEQQVRNDLTAELKATVAQDQVDEETRQREQRRLEGSAASLIEGRLKPAQDALQREIAQAKDRQRLEVSRAHDRIRFAAIGIPAISLALVVVLVAIRRVLRERSRIPSSRRREGTP